MEALRVEKLAKSFGALTVLHDISFTITSEESRVVIIGPNGAGKTTLFNLITGELTPSEGRTYLFSNNVTKMPCFRRTHLGMARTFQITDLFPLFTVMENLLLALQAHEPFRYQMFRPITAYGHIFEKAEGLLKGMDLFEKKDLLINTLSHGETRLVELLMGIATRPKIILLDEPTAGLTSSESEWLSNIIQKLLQNVTSVIIEHDMKIAFKLAERIIVLHQGRILADGDPEEIRANPKVREVYLGTEEV
ncbi:MAG: ABC transporter ATP-binding protein [Thermodesulfobacteriota bacterium]|nr:ABC transporter ATP-binding protein [Thermodesulfobacteriota bacterium]